MTIALITGGSRGLGRSAALHLARQGVGIVLTYQSNAKAAEEAVSEIAAEGGTAIALPLDTGKVASFAAFAEKLQQALQEKWGRTTFDYLVNNAGHGVHKPFAETTEEDFDGLVNVHLKGVFFLTQSLLPLIEDGGKILNVSTGLTRFALPGYSAYATMKGGIEVLTRYLARELGPRGIAVNAIAPGAIETDFGGGVVRDMPEVNKMVANSTAMGRVGRPDDIGGAVAAILSGGTGWITGQRIEVSGGQNI
ncbi:SDR family NAD(P)-dependent oxidoreductase [Ochrobactrum teleogrylli]|uniref:SDR family NAD(P)-dependent oxidoreductase n=1 Tax=Ochrobactrum teleogrylli TaxID=2479765 RepID=UPI00384B352A